MKKTPDLTPDLLAFGAVAVDDILYLDRFPEENTKMPVKRRERHAGGLAGTAVVTAARLGCNSAFCGTFDHEPLSQFILDTFQKEHVDISLCQIKPGAGPIHSTILVNKAKDTRTILFTNDRFSPPDLGVIPDPVWRGIKLVFIDSFIPGVFPKIVQTARKFNLPVIADIESIEGFQSLESIAEIQHLIINIGMGKVLSRKSAPSEILRVLETRSRVCTVITDGENGCWFKERGKAIYHMPAFKVPVVDTTGCGDVFHGAYAAAYVRGDSIKNALIQASAAAALKACKPGGQAGIPLKEELMAFLKKNPLGPSPV